MSLLRQSPIALVLGLLGLAMLLPAVFATLQQDWRTGRGFLYAALFTLVIAGLIAFALGTNSTRESPRRELGALLICWLLVPLFSAIPFLLILPAFGFWGSYFEMIAAVTTTGGTAIGDPKSVPDALHLWRGLAGWFGGFLTLMAAFIVLAPRRLGGFEIEAATWRHQSDDDTRRWLSSGIAPFEERVARAVRIILPTYLALTAILALIFEATGQGDLASMVHAMAVMSTSGISPYSSGLVAGDSFLGEFAALLFMALAATRLIYSNASQVGRQRVWRYDPELWMMIALSTLVTAALFLRHWVGALTIDLTDTALDGLEALWGNIFTVVSFLTTTGFQSSSWSNARDWSGLANPGLFLLGLAAIGGGAATTAGGIKLIRAYALMRHGMRELERIAQPSSVLGIGGRTRSMLREGPLIVWSFIMLFIFAILVTIIGLTATGMKFDTALIASISAISNTGPAFKMVTGGARDFADLKALQQMILAGAMIVGRFETLALIALFNPDVWGRGARFPKNPGKSSVRTANSDW